ncbi:MAG TPA: CPC_1213 family protein [Clostridia bacterium]|nr:CPC_1213 family protein [Clostridia bacterium]
MGNKMKSTRNKKKEDGKFRSKHVKHDPNAESARAVFGLHKPDSEDKK